MYGIPYAAKSIVKIDPTKPATTSTIGEEAEKVFLCDNGVLGGGGYIYAANMYGQVLQIDTTSNKYDWIGVRIYSRYDAGLGDPIVGADKCCIYWPPFYANRELKFDPETKQLPSLVVGGALGEESDK